LTRPFRSLRARLLAASSVLLVVVIGATLAWVGYQGNRLVSERLAADLARAAALIRTAQAERYDALRITAELLAAFPELNALAQTDAATIRDFLLDYQRRTGRADLLVLLAPQGQVLARTDSVTPTPLPDVEAQWIAPTLDGEAPAGVLETGALAYMGTAAAAEAAGHVFGFLIVGSRIDDALASRLREITGEEVVILGRTRVLGSTLAADTLPWKRLADWSAPAGRSDAAPGPREVQIAGERYVVREADAGTRDAVAFIGLQSRDRAMAPYRRIQAGLLLVGLLGALAGIGASAILARRISRPVARLVEGTRQVAAGNFDESIPVADIDELADLARAFNAMTRGLRERADMQKFVSQSTVEMIRAAGPAAPGGERRTLTILMSDIRGFTTLAETRPPEDVVTVLNRCLGMQAERVRAFGGDIDKFVGDAVVALFDGEDMALRAIRCAVEIQRAMDGLAREGVPVTVGIGIATGEVVLGSIGGGGRFDYTAVGLHVNLAARLSAMAGPREILLADSTWRPVRDLVAAEPLDDVVVRGLTAPVPVHRMQLSRA
jgi:class 3 adenylate cyclase